MKQLCIKCNVEIAEGRLKALPGTKTCVSCSTSKMKRPVVLLRGEGEDTYNDIAILDADEYERIFPDEGRKNTLD